MTGKTRGDLANQNQGGANCQRVVTMTSSDSGSDKNHFLDGPVREVEKYRRQISADFKQIGNGTVQLVGEVSQMKILLNSLRSRCFQIHGENASEDGYAIFRIPEIIKNIDGIVEMMGSADQLSGSIVSMQNIVDLHDEIGKVIERIASNFTRGVSERTSVRLATLRNDYARFIDSHRYEYSAFVSVKKRIHAMCTRYLLAIRDAYTVLLDEAQSHCSSSVIEMNELSESSSRLENSLISIATALQHEDLIRQNFEKIIFVTERLTTDDQSVTPLFVNGLESEDILCYLWYKKITSIKRRFRKQSGNLTNVI